LLCNIKKDLIRLYAERDSVKGEKERILKERATETWWSYISSLMIGNTVEFNQRRQRREREITDSIGKQRTKEWNIDLKLAEVQSLEGMLDSISSAEIEIKVKIAKIEERWRKRLSLQEMERALAKWKNQR
jgi:predicted nucleic-acid-binding protein